MAGCCGLSSLPEDLTISVEENTTQNEQKAIHGWMLWFVFSTRGFNN